MKIKTSRRNSIYTVNSFSLHLQKICDKNLATIRLKDSYVQRSEKKKNREQEFQLQALQNFRLKSKNRQEKLLLKMSI